jgi:hypothetical protein
MNRRKLAGILWIIAAGFVFVGSGYSYNLATMGDLDGLCNTMEPCLYAPNSYATLSWVLGISGGISFMIGIRLLSTEAKTESIQK